jgi:hypothetical protein
MRTVKATLRPPAISKVGSCARGFSPASASHQLAGASTPTLFEGVHYAFVGQNPICSY